MEKTTTTPHSKPLTPRKLGAILAVIIITLTIMACIAYYRVTGGSAAVVSTQSSVQEDLHPLGTFPILIKKDRWSPLINLGISQGRKIEWTTPEMDVPFRVMINGGNSAGGLEYDTPTREEIARTNWKPPFYAKQIVNVRFSLNPGPRNTAQLVYEITRVPTAR